MWVVSIGADTHEIWIVCCSHEHLGREAGTTFLANMCTSCGTLWSTASFQNGVRPCVLVEFYPSHFHDVCNICMFLHWLWAFYEKAWQNKVNNFVMLFFDLSFICLIHEACDSVSPGVFPDWRFRGDKNRMVANEANGGDAISICPRRS